MAVMFTASPFVALRVTVFGQAFIIAHGDLINRGAVKEVHARNSQLRIRQVEKDPGVNFFAKNDGIKIYSSIGATMWGGGVENWNQIRQSCPLNFFSIVLPDGVNVNC